MCGICGAVGFDRRDVLSEMNTCLTHRGPDSEGAFLDEGVMLGSRRLSILDVERGDQPIYSEDDDVVVVYNGEIYNFRTLRKELREEGHSFKTDTDTEVLVHGYEEYGPDIFARLNGMFAVALYDRTDCRLLLARDRTGIKPLYYAPIGGGCLFASEPKSILRSGLIEPAVDEDALSYFLQLRYSPPHTTLFDGVETVLPGHYLEIHPEGSEWTIESNEYWTPTLSDGDPPTSPERAVERALERAVERQLVSERPVGFYLSGGLDTSSVVAVASALTDDPIHTFCMGFEDQQWDERADARAVADHFGTIHHEFGIERDFMQDFPEMIWHADEPKRNLYPYYVAEEMSKHVTVALGGLGADELFGGYVYRFDRLRELERLRTSVPDRERNLLQRSAGIVADSQLAVSDLEHDDILEDLETLRYLDQDVTLYVLLNSTDVLGSTDFYRKRMFGPALDSPVVPGDWIEARFAATDHGDLRERALAWDYAIKLPDDFLLVEDRMSMAHSLESRVPFLDNELVDLALSIPLSEKFGPDESEPRVGKRILRRAMEDRLPEQVFEKDKQGFTMPTYPFVRDEMLSHARCILDNSHVVREGFVREAYLQDLLGRTPTESLIPHYKFLWKVVALEIWYQMYVVDDVDGPRDIEHYYT